MTEEEKMLFSKASPAARNLFQQAKQLERAKRRAEWKATMIKQTQLTPIPAQSAFAVRPDKSDRE